MLRASDPVSARIGVHGRDLHDAEEHEEEEEGAGLLREHRVERTVELAHAGIETCRCESRGGNRCRCDSRERRGTIAPFRALSAKRKRLFEPKNPEGSVLRSSSDASTDASGGPIR